MIDTAHRANGVHAFDGGGRPAIPAWYVSAQALHSLPVLVRCCLATLLVLLTLLLRVALVQDAPGYHFIFFIPSVILSSLFLARGSGIWAVLLSAVLIKGFFLSKGSFVRFDHTEDLWALVVFTATGLVAALASEALHQAFFAVAEANEHLAAANRELESANRRIAASEHDKEVLLHEVTHRFKNDLANLTSILRLQARDASDPAARTELMAASERVQVMGRVHHRLNGFGKVAAVDLGKFLTDLCDDLRVAMVGTRPIVLRAEAKPGHVPLPQAITVGMIVNELVMNAFKYAFPANRPGQVLVHLEHDGGTYSLLVSDDGIGQASSVPTASGLGQRLVRSMAQQLGGTYDAKVSETGRTCMIRFAGPSAAGA